MDTPGDSDTPGTIPASFAAPAGRAGPGLSSVRRFDSGPGLPPRPLGASAPDCREAPTGS